MQGTSPFGQFAPVVASVAALGILGMYLAAIFFGQPINVGLQDLAWLAAGAIFGSAVAVNGWKPSLTAAHTRIDKVSQAVSTIAAENPKTVRMVNAIMSDPSTAEASAASPTPPASPPA